MSLLTPGGIEMPFNKTTILQTAAAVSLVLITAAGCSLLMSGYLDLPRPRHVVTVEKNIMVPMRDGVRLATDVYRPAGVEGPLPVILTRLPDNKNFVGMVGALLAGPGDADVTAP
jgi:predicted acyl esterase